MQARSQARRKWEDQRLERAAEGDWKSLKQVRRKQEQWEPGLAEANGGSPHEAIHQHLEEIYQGQPLGAWEWEDDEPTEPFTLQELQEAAEKGKLKKAVGSDKVSHELLLQISRDEHAAPKLLDWCNNILQTGDMPLCWNEVVMVVLPKIRTPVEAKHVRPISLSSATLWKRFARLGLTGGNAKTRKTRKTRKTQKREKRENSKNAKIAKNAKNAKSAKQCENNKKYA